MIFAPVLSITEQAAAGEAHSRDPGQVKVSDTFIIPFIIH